MSGTAVLTRDTSHRGSTSHHVCGVPECDLSTLDVLCPSHRDKLVVALKAIATGGVQRVRIHKTWYPLRYLVDPDTGEIVTDPDTGKPVPCARTFTSREEVDYYPGLWEELEVTLTRQDKIGAGQVHVRTKDGDTPDVFHERASDARRDLAKSVRYWRMVFAVANPHLEHRPSGARADCEWMARFPSLLAGHPDAVRMFGDFTRLVAKITRLIDRAPDRVYLGICSAPTDAGFPCAQDVWGLEGRDYAHCRSCGQWHDVRARQDALRAAVEKQVATPTDIARSFAGYVGMQISVSSIRTWARNGELMPVAYTASGHPKYRVGDVTDLARTKETRPRRTPHIPSQR